MPPTDQLSIQTSEPLWRPSQERVAAANLTAFVRWLANRRGLSFADYEALWGWSVGDLEGFWSAIWEFYDVRSSAPHRSVMLGSVMPAVEWFPGARLNFVEQVMRHDAQAAAAIVHFSESGQSGEISWPELRRSVAAVAATLKRLGVAEGDRVAAYLPNVPETVIAFLAVASLGAVWSVCAPEMGIVSVAERFTQITPRVLIAADGYCFAGRVFDRREAVAELLAELTSVNSVIWVPILGEQRSPSRKIDERCQVFDWPDAVKGEHPLSWIQVPFEHPLWVVYSSGTTGTPKAIVHGHGGMLISGLVSMSLHLDLKAADRFLWYSSTGWIVWNVQIMGLLVGATICIFDGSVTGAADAADLSTLWRFVAEKQVKFFGAGAAYFAACLKADVRPGQFADLSKLTSLGSTGSPLSPECYRWVYASIKTDILLISPCGGTDIAGGFLTGTPTLPVYLGEMQCRNLGAAVHALDEDGRPVVGSVGELVCTRPMPSMPIYFWNDPDKSRYKDSYFAELKGPHGEPYWRQGDWLKLTDRPEAIGAIVYGRSDATINRHGIRMGTSELYRIVEAHVDILDSMAVDLEYLGRPSYLGLFVVMRPGVALTAAIVATLREQIRTALSPRHVPDEILEVPAVPRTLTGKKLEVPVKKLLLGQPLEKVVARGSIANPESLDWYVEFAQRRNAGNAV